VKFEVYEHGKPTKKFEVRGAYVFGVDGIPVRLGDKITFKNGLIECKKRNAEAAGLASLWPVQGFGEVLLSTTRLQDRPRPYNLNVELARGKLMEITVKREDWAVFEEDSSIADKDREARGLFIESLQHIAEPGKAASLADQSLERAMVLAEELAARHAELLFEARLRSNGFSKHCLGCRVEPAKMSGSGYVEKLLSVFGFVTIPVNWAHVETQRGTYDFSGLDTCIRALANKKVAMCAGPLLRFSRSYLPRWLLAGDRDFEKIREAAYEFVSKLVSRYSNRVHAWRVVSGLNALNYFKFSFGQILEMTRAANLAARAANAKSLKLVEILYPWGEYYATQAETMPPLVYVDMVTQSGISFDAFGLELAFGRDVPGMHVRDMMQISAMLDRFSVLNKPLHITGVAVPDRAGEEPHHGGVWRKQWDQTVQAKWLEQFYKVALSKPFVDTVTYSMLSDRDKGDVAFGGLLTDELEAKKSFHALQHLRKEVCGQ
jgi:GH35 family endo-1,4-beta-xylanase